MTDLIIIPTYNERDNIELLIRCIDQLDTGFHILVVDDNSPDGTAECIKALQAEKFQDSVHLLKREGKLGLGTAYIAGFKWALERDYQRIFEMDADFSHHPKYLADFIRKIEQGADIVLGSRYIEGGGVRNWGIIRRMISKGGSFYARNILGIKVRDVTGGFKCFKREALQQLNLDDVRCTGYAFQIELTYRATLKGLKIVETPIEFADRTIGQSKMSKKIFVEAMWKVIWMRLHKAQLSA